MSKSSEGVSAGGWCRTTGCSRVSGAGCLGGRVSVSSPVPVCAGCTCVITSKLQAGPAGE